MIRLLAIAGLTLVPLFSSAQEDRLESTITGNQEQPQVLYIVPWQTPESPTLKYNVVQSQSAKVYEHLERSELKRELSWLELINEEDSAESEQDHTESSGESPPTPAE
ncbi:hypothetical protein QWI17_02090 [Gilvimarinus sp. SDUM040013]|uniref:Uncharacterized protein n=1 Tax=Gilvimarinus gilvus TaxID=3058038 RepID=A0ABU4RZB4_9GAMM|nr:hypothetical protein [Gilvimarinus sp. SDUM040013]MDO3384621.1 hypothetical protein [Gilvimarinus sp. SDUM040013]MDX6850207.1 hypothetical protein [Gilvimarinus sp. SDUM040013]